MSLRKGNSSKIDEAVSLFFEEKSEYIRGTVLYLALHGSHAYGSNHEGSDIDLSGVFIAPMNDLLGLNRPQETYDKQDDDYDIYMHEVGKFFGLAMKGNPNAIEVLWGPPLYVHPHFHSILENKNDFLSQEFISRCKGFANAQMGRIKRGSGGKIHNHKRNKHAFHILRLLKMAHRVARGETGPDLIKVQQPELVRRMIKSMSDTDLSAWMEEKIELIDVDRYSDKNDLKDTPDFDPLNQQVIDLRHKIEMDLQIDHKLRLIGEDLA